ncbi:MAG: hypothetical protein JETCAE01_13460 [Anaerolineaceae bacterium]|nr:MAG: hypothetical protein JETCAE01_13460 [Anaerolineaceae bacterium]
MPHKLILLLILTLTLITPTYAQAAPHTGVEADSAELDFPNTVTFSAVIKSNADIVSVTLEYGNEQLTCGEVIAKAFPDFQPGKSADVSWTWDMRQSGSLPPGTQIWWRWRYTDSSGAEFVSETKTTTWLDDTHDWQTVSKDNVRIHYYGNNQAFGQTMLDAGLEGLRRNKEQAGMTPDVPVDIYVYPNYEDMRDAILYEPQWTGGLAYSDFSIIIMGISGNASFDKGTIIHELTHVLVGRNAFTCIGFIPTWLNEGLAVYSEGGPDSSMQAQLDIAIRDNTLFPIRSLGGNFSEIPEKALLSYGQSYSVVKYMLETYGQEKMNQLLTALSDAEPVDDALVRIYGVDTDGLDTQWRKSLGLPALVIAQATAQPTPTHVPTFIPIAGIPQAVTPTPGAIPTSSFTNPDQPTRTGPPLSLTIALICFCLVFLLVIGVIALGFFVRSGNAKGRRSE